jgi:hypothetical protein
MPPEPPPSFARKERPRHTCPSAIRRERSRGRALLLLDHLGTLSCSKPGPADPGRISWDKRSRNFKGIVLRGPDSDRQEARVVSHGDARGCGRARHAVEPPYGAT